jgi:hypothetical protein
MDDRAAGLRAQARKCRELAIAALVPSSIDLLLRIAREFEAAADRIEDGAGVSRRFK